jgi:hypothetical protein
VTGVALKGHSGFVAKDGEPFDCRLNLRLHFDMVEQMEQRKRPDESMADWIRSVLRRELLHPTGD